jgi:23S rRNA (cytosine1962-C5)-methyltransferase/23S rRNA (guanine2445-N2)-methyltransferase / 23S rRNA (guanine2069-N7)-methyltransferase
MADFQELLNRLKKNEKKRRSHVKQLQIEAYRLYDRDIPAYPYIIDRYKDYFLIYEKGNKAIDRELISAHQKDVAQAVEELFEVKQAQILFKKREEKRGKNQYDKLTHFNSKRSEQEIIVVEGGIKFIINLFDYLDVGLFLDHRPIRSKIKKMSHGKKVLNLFSYTSSISLYAAMGGAQTISVDKSKNYLDWSKRNFEVNDVDLSIHQFVAKDSMEFLDICLDKFDIIFIDPPTFSNEKKKQLVFEVEKDQEELISKAMSCLRPKGILFFSTNKRTFKLSEKLKENYYWNDISKKTIPFDFDDKKIHYCFQFQHRSRDE